MKKRDADHHGQDHAHHAQDKIRKHFAQQKINSANRRDQNGFHGSSLPFAGHYQGGQKDSDQGHDQSDEAWDQKVATDGRLVEPDPLGHLHGRNSHLLASGLTQGGPFLKYPARVSLDKPGPIGIDAVDNHLNRRRVLTKKTG